MAKYLDKSGLQYFWEKIKGKITSNAIEINKKVSLYENAEARYPVVNFIFDDNCDEDTQLLEIFKNKGVKCGFAITTDSNLTDAKKEFYKAANDEGFSILSHSSEATAMGDNTSFYSTRLIPMFRNSIRDIEDAGIICSGWVTPASYLKDSYFWYLKRWYNYGFTRYYGAYNGSGQCWNTTYDSQYYLKRVHIGTSTIENLKAAVLNSEGNFGYLTFYGHGYELTNGTLTVSKLEELIDYVKGRESSKLLKCLSPDEAINYYFKTRSDKKQTTIIDVNNTYFNGRVSFAYFNGMRIVSLCGATKTVASNTTVFYTITDEEFLPNDLIISTMDQSNGNYFAGYGFIKANGEIGQRISASLASSSKIGFVFIY